ncbi:MAG: AAA family ATPase [Deltaproteobacteria bacterium]|nr:AAA family ATPase [Deltaproteobacteria bacterium]
MDYLAFYDLRQEPFSVMPLTKFYYHSEQHDRALAKLQFAVSAMKGLAVLVGDVGTGKTTLARRLLDSLPEDEYEASLLVIIHSDVDADWFVRRIMGQLGVPDPPADRSAALTQLFARLAEINEQGRKAVVIIDEAQMLRQPLLMETLRGLLNLELPEQKLLSFVLFGLPELDAVLQKDAPLAQRIAVRHQLEPFATATTADYIDHRLSLAGRDAPIFTAAALDTVHAVAKGVPRVINVVCDNALFEGYIRKAPAIDVDIIQNVASDLGLHE